LHQQQAATARSFEVLLGARIGHVFGFESRPLILDFGKEALGREMIA
jgi:hypothetical protein